MSLSRRDFLKVSGTTAASVAAGTGLDLAPVEAAATSSVSRRQQAAPSGSSWSVECGKS